MMIVMKVCLWLLALVPLVVDHAVFYPETTGKNLFIESILVAIGIFFVINLFYSRVFREEVRLKLTRYFKNRLFLAVLAFILIFIISTIFAVDKYSAFWGNIERVEGLVGVFFFFSFFIFSLLIFERKDWLWFLKLSLFTSIILLSKQLLDLSDGILRSGAFTGNPTYLAGYLLFSITAGLIVMNEGKNIFFKYLSWLVIILSVIGIFLAQTRGTILGLGFGLFSILIYAIFIGKNISYKKINLRTTALSLICLGIIFSGVFVFTRKSEIWKSIPGLSRIASLGQGVSGDSTVSRVFTLQSGWNSIKPAQNGWKKMLIGWGPDNFILAYGKYYNPGQYKIEAAWFDRAHNKFMDVLVMNGLFGLAVYLSIWFLYFVSLRRNYKSGLSLTSIGLLFFGTSFIVHLLFIFDQISTSIPVFMLLAFAVYQDKYSVTQTSDSSQLDVRSKNTSIILVVMSATILVIFLSFVFFKNTLPSYSQNRNFSALIKNTNSSIIQGRIDTMLMPFTSAQMDIRKILLVISNDIYNRKLNGNDVSLINKALNEGEKYLGRRSFDFRFFGTLANVYSNIGYKSKNIEYLRRGETLYHNMLDYIPDRPDIIYGLAVNLTQQQRFLESFNYFEKTFDVNPTISAGDREKFEAVYTRLVQYFYEQRDKENFVKVADRLKANAYRGSTSLDKVLNYLNDTGIWPKIDFNI